MTNDGKTHSGSPWSHRPGSAQASKNSPSPSSGSRNPNDVSYAQLKQYEATRRLAYSSKFDSMSLYWKSHRDLLGAALSETSRAQRLVLGTCRAHQVYADAMSAMSDDVFLDEKGNVANKNQQKRLWPIRIEKLNQSTRGTSSIVAEIREGQQEVAEKFGENAKNMDEEIADAIGALLEDVKQQFSTTEELGSSILTELEKTESEVTAAWGRYLSQSDMIAKTGSLSPSNQETAPNGTMYDTWIVETQYRVAVAYQNTAWDKGSAQLDELFRKVRQEEINRRMNLREFLVAFAQRQQRLFLSLPGIHTSVLEQLVGKEVSREEIERNVRAAVKDKITIASDINKNGGPPLESPLTSDLLSKAKVVERRGLSPGAEWIVSLAVMTADSYLHFFDLEDSRISLSSTPEAAFQVLMPSVVVPTAENVLLGKANFAKGWTDTLTPTESIILARCLLQSSADTVFSITEKGGGTTAASKMFGKLVDKKIQIRTQTRADRDDWINILTSQC